MIVKTYRGLIWDKMIGIFSLFFLTQGYEDMEATALIRHGDYGIYMYWAPQKPMNIPPLGP